MNHDGSVFSAMVKTTIEKKYITKASGHELMGHVKAALDAELPAH